MIFADSGKEERVLGSLYLMSLNVYIIPIETAVPL